MTRTSTADRTTVLRVPADDPELRDAVADPGTDVSVAAVGHAGIASLAPLVTASVDGRTAFYPACSPAVATTVAVALADGELADDGRGAVVEHPLDATTLPTPALGGLDVGVRHLLGGAGWRQPAEPDDHDAAGGFLEPGADEIRATAGDLLGRGWGDWRQDEPVREDWERARDADEPVAVVVNAHGTRSDALLCESVPFEVLEGACHVAEFADADRIVVYLASDDETAAERVDDAVDAYPDPPVPLTVVTGPDAYRAAEPTMALEAIEGNHRLEARLRTPDGSLPTLDGRPALVHTARTYGHLALGLRTGNAPTTRLVSVSGDVDAPATVELSAGAPLEAAMDAVDPTGAVKAACVGGRFGGMTTSLNVEPTPDALTEAGLGTEGTVEVLGEDRCVLSFVGQRTQFASDGNCGRCVPCREGSTQLASLLRDIYDGDFDRDAIAELVRNMTATSVCTFGADAGRPARTAVDLFDAELAAHAEGRCPAGTCPDPAEVTT